jgi:prepilin-type N-terminal cleavage/methylation domain-containing protein
MRHCSRTSIRSAKGVTLIELIVVMVIIGILAAIAAPNFIALIRNADYRSTARHAASFLRQAKSTAITTNREQQVVLRANKYGMVASPQAFGTQTASWPAITIWNTMPVDVKTGATQTIQFTPNGIASLVTGTVNITDSTGTNRYQIIVSSVGRISVIGPLK